MLLANKSSLFKLFKNLLLIAVLLTAITSCAPQKRLIDIQTLKPSELRVPKDFSQPIIISNIYKGIEDDYESMAQAALDSTAALEAAIVLSESLNESPLFQGLNIPVKSYYRHDSSRSILPFDWSTVDRLCSDDNADLLISLEYIKITPNTDSYPFWDGAAYAYYGSLTMNVYAFWRVYDLRARKVLAEHLHRDTLIWEEYDYTNVKIGYQLPGFFSAAAYCGYLAGLEYSQLIAPTWMDEQRLYFASGSKEMRNASELVASNKWLDAAAIWQRVIQNPDSKDELKAKAAFNMAVANEMLGNFDVSLEWLSKSSDFFSIPEQNWYVKLLELRIKLLERL